MDIIKTLDVKLIEGVSVKCTKSEFNDIYRNKLDSMGYTLIHEDRMDGTERYPELFLNLKSDEMYFATETMSESTTYPVVNSQDEFFDLVKTVRSYRSGTDETESDELVDEVPESYIKLEEAVEDTPTEFPVKLTQVEAKRLYNIAPEEHMNELLHDMKWGHKMLTGEPITVTEDQCAKFRSTWTTKEQKYLLNDIFGPAPWSIADAQRGDLVLVNAHKHGTRDWSIRVVAGKNKLYLHGSVEGCDTVGLDNCTWERYREFTPENFELAKRGNLS